MIDSKTRAQIEETRAEHEFLTFLVLASGEEIGRASCRERV